MAYLGQAIYVICLVVISEIFAIPPKCKYIFSNVHVRPNRPNEKFINRSMVVGVDDENFHLPINDDDFSKKGIKAK